VHPGGTEWMTSQSDSKLGQKTSDDRPYTTDISPKVAVFRLPAQCFVAFYPIF